MQMQRLDLGRGLALINIDQHYLESRLIFPECIFNKQEDGTNRHFQQGKVSVVFCMCISMWTDAKTEELY